MFQTFANVQRGEALVFRNTCQPRCGNLQVGLRSIAHTVRCNKVNARQTISWWNHPNYEQTIEPWDYTASQILEVSTVSRFITFPVNAGLEVRISELEWCRKRWTVAHQRERESCYFTVVTMFFRSAGITRIISFTWSLFTFLAGKSITNGEIRITELWVELWVG